MHGLCLVPLSCFSKVVMYMLYVQLLCSAFTLITLHSSQNELNEGIFHAILH